MSPNREMDELTMGNSYTQIYRVVKTQWTRDFPGGPVSKICTPNVEGLSSIPGQGTRSRVPQLRTGSAK